MYHHHNTTLHFRTGVFLQPRSHSTMVDKYLTVNLASLAELWILDMRPCCLHKRLLCIHKHSTMQPCNLRFPVASLSGWGVDPRRIHLGRPKKGGTNGPLVPALFAAVGRTCGSRSTSRGQNLTTGSWLHSGDVVEVNWDDVWWPCDILEVSSHLQILLWGRFTTGCYGLLHVAYHNPFFHSFFPYQHQHHQHHQPRVVVFFHFSGR